MDQHRNDGQLPSGLAHDPAGLAAHRQIREQITALTEQVPGHTITIEDWIPGRAARFVAKATASDAHPYLVITTDLDELRRELTSPQPSLPRRVPGTSWTPPATA